MIDLWQDLKSEFQDEDYRYAYAESFLNSKLATQIKTLREQRKKTQADIGLAVGTKQSGFSRFEDVNHSVWKTDTLWKIARALGVRLNISFETFSSLIEEKETLSRENLMRSDFHGDLGFPEDTPNPFERMKVKVYRSPSGNVLHLHKSDQPPVDAIKPVETGTFRASQSSQAPEKKPPAKLDFEPFGDQEAIAAAAAALSGSSFKQYRLERVNNAGT